MSRAKYSAWTVDRVRRLRRIHTAVSEEFRKRPTKWDIITALYNNNREDGEAMRHKENLRSILVRYKI